MEPYLSSMCSIFIDDPFLNIVNSSDDPLPMQHPRLAQLRSIQADMKSGISAICKSLW